MPSTVEVTRAPTTPSPEEDEMRRDETLSDDSTTDEETRDIEPPPVITASIKLGICIYKIHVLYNLYYRHGMLRFRSVVRPC